MRYIILILAVILPACSGRVIPAEKMPEIIAEVYLADKYVENNNNLNYNADSIRFCESIFNKYGYTTDDYVRTIDKYISRTKKMKVFYEDAKTILEQKREEIRLAVEDRNRGDSISDSYNNIRNNTRRALFYIREKQSDKWIVFPYSSGKWPDTDSVPVISYISKPFDRMVHVSGVSTDTAGIGFMYGKMFGRSDRRFPEWLFMTDDPADTLRIGAFMNYRLLTTDMLSPQNDSMQ